MTGPWLSGFMMGVIVTVLLFLLLAWLAVVLSPRVEP